jgi:hypothetical protein
MRVELVQGWGQGPGVSRLTLGTVLRAGAGQVRKARNLALAYYIDSLVRSGEVADLAAVARMCGVSRARVSKVVGLLGMAGAEKELVLHLTR